MVVILTIYLLTGMILQVQDFPVETVYSTKHEKNTGCPEAHLNQPPLF